METVKMKIADLHEDPKNARRHNKKNIDLICKSLKMFEQYKPIVVQKGTNKIIAGNGTYRAAKLLGLTEIDCNVIDITDEKASALAIVDNRTTDLSNWDDDVLAPVLDSLGDDLLEVTGFSDNDIEKMLNKGKEDENKNTVSGVEEWNVSDVEMNPAWIVIRTNTDNLEKLLEFIETKSNMYRQLEFSCDGGDGKKDSEEQTKDIAKKVANIKKKNGEENAKQ